VLWTAATLLAVVPMCELPVTDRTAHSSEPFAIAPVIAVERARLRLDRSAPRAAPDAIALEAPRPLLDGPYPTSEATIGAALHQTGHPVEHDDSPRSATPTPDHAASPPLLQLAGLEGLPGVQTEPRGWKYIVLHHSATSSGSVESIDVAHRQRVDAAGRPWRGIGYHFVIGNGDGFADGAVAATFRWREQSDGAHAGVAEFNQLGVGICLIGNFETARPTARQLAAARRLVQRLQDQFRIDDDRVLTHRDLKPTACPGAQFTASDLLRRPRELSLQTRDSAR